MRCLLTRCGLTALLAFWSLVLSEASSWAIAPLSVQQVAPGIYVHHGVHEEATPENMGAIANIGFIVGSTAVAVVDTGGSFREGEALIAAIHQVTRLPIRYVINTHFHPDHVLGNAAFSDLKPIFVAHANLPRGLAARSADYLAMEKANLGSAFDGTQIVLPQHLVATTERLDLGGRTLLLQAYPPAHTDADLTVLDEKTATLFAGDLLFLERVPSVDGSILGWLKAIDQLAAVKAVRAIPGHGPVSAPWPQALADEKRYLSLLVKETREQLEAGHSLQDAVKSVGLSERSKWQLFDGYNQRNVTTAYTELEWE